MGKGKGQGACIQVAKGWKALNMTHDVQQCCEHCCTTLLYNIVVQHDGNMLPTCSCSGVWVFVGHQWSAGSGQLES